MNKKLTIGIPTFQRKDVVLDNVFELLNDEIIKNNDISIIIIDNCSNDGTFEELKDLIDQQRHPNISVFQNHTNIGVFSSIFKIFDLCKTDYLMLLSDEDHVITSNLAKVLAFLNKHSPAFVCPQFILNDVVYRGNFETRAVKTQEWEKSAYYISGLIYDVDSIKKILSAKKQELLKPYIYYPWNLMVSELLCFSSKGVWFIDIPIAFKKYDLETKISNEFSEGKYWHIASRWEQLKAVDEYFRKCMKSAPNTETAKKFDLMRKTNLQSFYSAILHSITAERADLVKDIEDGAEKKINGYLALPFKLIRKLTWIFHIAFMFITSPKVLFKKAMTKILQVYKNVHQTQD